MFDEFKFVGEKLINGDIVSLYSGRLAVKRDGKIIATRIGAMLSELKESDLAEVLQQGDDKLLSAVFGNSGAEAVILAKPAYAMALSQQEEKILPQDVEGKNFLKIIPVVRVRDLNSTDEIIRFLAPAFKNGAAAVIVRGYGSFAIGQNLEEALKQTSVLERSCKIALLARGIAPKEMKKEEKRTQYRSAIPPSIGVMDRSYRDRGKR